MPGPANTKKKAKPQGKATKKTRLPQTEGETEWEARHVHEGLNKNMEFRTMCEGIYSEDDFHMESSLGPSRIQADDTLPQVPVIHDPGNGPRIRNAHSFVNSRFAQPPAVDDSLSAEFAQEEVLEMLLTILPEEVAYILWYNKSRSNSRVCPACLRLYRVGDLLADHVPEQQPLEGMQSSSPRLRREQELSGLCSAVCFIAAAFKYPSAIKPAWGRMAEELDEYTWNLLNGPPESSTGDAGLSMLMRMTRLHDLGLAQLCFGLCIEDMDETH